uniref:Uncharacterized protein n=1 Tax=Arundo donax TaxID=35708 RepID=A0A0A8XXT3_ARUDO
MYHQGAVTSAPVAPCTYALPAGHIAAGGRPPPRPAPGWYTVMTPHDAQQIWARFKSESLTGGGNRRNLPVEAPIQGEVTGIQAPRPPPDKLPGACYLPQKNSRPMLQVPRP